MPHTDKKGFEKIARAPFLNGEWHRNPNVLSVYVHLLFVADIKTRTTDISERRLAAFCGLSKSVTHRALKTLQDSNAIEICKTSATRSLITICNNLSVKSDDLKPNQFLNQKLNQRFGQNVNQFFERNSACKSGDYKNKNQKTEPTFGAGYEPIVEPKSEPTYIIDYIYNNIDNNVVVDNARARERDFDIEDQWVVEQTCMSLGITLDEYQALAPQVLAGWDFIGEEDQTRRHFLSTMRIKVRELRDKKRKASSRKPTRAESETFYKQQMERTLYNLKQKT